MNILVFGASGKTGREIVSRSLGRGHHVTAFTRDPAKLGQAHERLRTVTGDVADAAAIHAAIPGHDIVVSALGVGRPLRHDQIVIDGVGHILRGMEKAAVARFVYLSTIAVSFGRDAVGAMMRFAARYPLRNEVGDHDIKERLIRPSALDWTIHAPALTMGPYTGRYRVGDEITALQFLPALLSRADVAEAMVQEIDAHQFPRKAMRVLPM
jgi:putative NADH-flavin reductase